MKNLNDLSEFCRELYESRERETEQLRAKKLELEMKLEEVEQDIANNERWNRELLEEDDFNNFEDSPGYKYFISRAE